MTDNAISVHLYGTCFLNIKKKRKKGICRLTLHVAEATIRWKQLQNTHDQIYYADMKILRATNLIFLAFLGSISFSAGVTISAIKNAATEFSNVTTASTTTTTVSTTTKYAQASHNGKLMYDNEIFGVKFRFCQSVLNCATAL